jgi:hypothetical protein
VLRKTALGDVDRRQMLFGRWFDAFDPVPQLIS